MEIKINYIHAMYFTNLYYTPQGQGNYKNKVEFRKMDLRFFPINFQGSFILSQNAYHALILGHL